MSLSHHWWRSHLTWRTAPLLLIAWLFGCAGALRRALYACGVLASQRVPVPVVVVGNLVVGGSGKTPLVIALAHELARLGLSPGVISRGYGGSARDVIEVDIDADPTVVGDEPLLIRRRAACPVFVGAARVQAARALLSAYPDTRVIVADDGLQHLKLAADFRIAVFDSRCAGNGRLLPAGPLREPLSRLDQVDAVVINDGRCALPGRSYAMQLVPGAYRRVDDSGTCAPGDFARQHATHVAAVAGIGNPERFFDTLRATGLVVDAHAFPDHHAFSRDDLARVPGSHVMMTEKDALKCEAFADARLWVVPVSATLDAGLIDSIKEKLRGPKAA